MDRLWPLLVLILPTLLWVQGCAYLQETARQARIAEQQKLEPRQRAYKHLLETEKFFVYGKIQGQDADLPAACKATLAVLALSDAHKKAELVDAHRCSGPGAHYGLALPEGEYALLLVCDRNQDGVYEAREILGGRSLRLGLAESPGKVLGELDIELGRGFAHQSGDFRVPVPAASALKESLFYPKGAIRALDDPLFSPQLATLGMYAPAAFMEQAGTLFYALEEDKGYKIPVALVHGAGGSPRDFRALVDRLDRRLYRFWFFYYPSGNGLAQVSELFYRIFLSGKVIPLHKTPMVIIAHSMGGLVVREALNHCAGQAPEAQVALLVTIASPLEGHPAARRAESAPLTPPAWRDVSPESEFLRGLFRRPLPRNPDYPLRSALLFACSDCGDANLGTRPIRTEGRSDGVVPLSSQLRPEALREARVIQGFSDTHAGVLGNERALQRILDLVNEVKPNLPAPVLAELLKGGYDFPLSDAYSPLQKYSIRTIGRYLDALAAGRLAPIDEFQERFMRVLHGELEPETEVEKGWMRFMKEYPERNRQRR